MLCSRACVSYPEVEDGVRQIESEAARAAAGEPQLHLRRRKRSVHLHRRHAHARTDAVSTRTAQRTAARVPDV
eukprot:4102640-Pleurochrysis_carterae.AAC.2